MESPYYARLFVSVWQYSTEPADPNPIIQSLYIEQQIELNYRRKSKQNNSSKTKAYNFLILLIYTTFVRNLRSSHSLAPQPVFISLHSDGTD